MAYTTPRTWVAGEIVTAANMNTHVRDNITFLHDRIGCRLRRAANQTVATATSAAISWDTEDEDTNGFITVTSTTVTIPAGFGGLYVVTARVSVVGNTVSGRSFLDLAPSGGNIYRTPFGDGGEDKTSVTAIMALGAGATLTSNVFHSSGADRAFTAGLDLLRVGA